MKLTDIPGIGPSLAKKMKADNWTVKKVATTRPFNLSRYPGVGTITSAKIILAAQRMINEALLEEAIKSEAPEIAPTPPTVMSERVKRINAGKQNQ